MRIHLPDTKPDWELTPEKQRSLLQQLAAASSGTLTPGNILSGLGVAIVAWGAEALYTNTWSKGVTLITIGRVFDLFDGYAADMTHTKSRTGETVDALCDKITVLIILITTFATRTLNPLLLLLVLFHHLCTGIFGLFWGRRHNLHSGKAAKYASFVSWLAILAGLIGQHYPHIFWVYGTADILVAIYVGFIAAAIYSYAIALRIATTARD